MDKDLSDKVAGMMVAFKTTQAQYEGDTLWGRNSTQLVTISIK